jgi:hypothetical protein
VHTSEQVALVLVLDVMDRQGRDDRIERPARKRRTQIPHDYRGGARGQPLPRPLEHLRGSVEQNQLNVRIARQHRLTQQPRPSAKVEYPPNGPAPKPDEPCRRPVKEIEARNQTPPLRIVVSSMSRENA